MPKTIDVHGMRGEGSGEHAEIDLWPVAGVSDVVVDRASDLGTIECDPNVDAVVSAVTAAAFVYARARLSNWLAAR